MLENLLPPFRIAYTFAKKSLHPHYKIGACVSRGRCVLSGGSNQINKTHPLLSYSKHKFNGGLHAEQHACIGVHSSYLIDANIYVLRLRRNGTIGLAKPCEMCRAYLMQKGIRKIYYTISNKEFGYLRLNKRMDYYEEK